MENLLAVGDTIQCHDAEEMIQLMTVLEKEGFQTEFLYEKDGQEGLWLLIEKVEGKNERNKDNKQSGEGNT